MPNYDLPKPTPADALAKRFSQIRDLELDPVATISQSLDAVADAIRLYADDVDALRELAQQLSISAHDIASVAGLAAPAPAPTRRKKAADPAD